MYSKETVFIAVNQPNVCIVVLMSPLFIYIQKEGSSTDRYEVTNYTAEEIREIVFSKR